MVTGVGAEEGLSNLSLNAIHPLLSAVGGETARPSIRSLLSKSVFGGAPLLLVYSLQFLLLVPLLPIGPVYAATVAELLRVQRVSTESDLQFAASLEYTLEKVGVIRYDPVLDRMVLGECRDPSSLPSSSGESAVSSSVASSVSSEEKRP